MRNAARRTDKYGKKIRGLVLEGQSENYIPTAAARLHLEQCVKREAIQPMLQFSYVAFLEELLKHKANKRPDEAEGIYNKWLNRGLDSATLVNTANCIGVAISPAPPPPACENFLAPAWTENDVPGVITVMANRATAAAFTRGDNSYFYRDMGAGHFAGNLDHDLTVFYSSTSANLGRWGVWGLSNVTNYEYGTGGSQNQGLFVALLTTAGGNFYIDIGQNNYAVSDRSIPLNKDQEYFLTIKRTGTLFSCNIYSNAARTILVDTISCAVSMVAYRYIYAAFPEGGSTGSPAYGYCDCLLGLV